MCHSGYVKKSRWHTLSDTFSLSDTTFQLQKMCHSVYCMYCLLIHSCFSRKNPYQSNFNVNEQNRNGHENRPSEPQFYIVRIFVSTFVFSKLENPQIAGICSMQVSTPLSDQLRIFFFTKNVLHTEKPILPKFYQPKCFTWEMRPKSKKEEA